MFKKPFLECGERRKKIKLGCNEAETFRAQHRKASGGRTVRNAKHMESY